MKSLLKKVVQKWEPRVSRCFLKKKVSGAGNKFRMSGARLRKCRVVISGNNNTLEFQEGVFARNMTFHIRGNNNHVKLGENVSLHGGGSLWMEDDGGRIVIGRDGSFGQLHIAVTENQRRVEIGEGCLFSDHIEIRTGDSHGIHDIDTDERTNRAKDVLIGDRVWLGMNVSVLKGAIIKNDCVVGSRSVVTRAFDQSNVVLAGSPAKVVKEGIYWKSQRD